MRPRVAVTGVGAVTPLGTGAGVLHRRWVGAECAIEDGRGTCAGFAPDDVLARREARRMDRYVQMGVAAADEATRQAGWEDQLPYDAARVGCVVATAIAGQATVEQQLERVRTKGPLAVAPLRVLNAAPNGAAVAIAMRFGLQGECLGLSAACAGGAQAIGTGMRMIQSGAADAAVVGGADAALTAFGDATYAALGAVSPSGECRPFDERRDGMVPGEGAAMLVLEDADRAAERGAPVLGEVLGFGAGNDAAHLTMPDCDGQTRTMLAALADAGVDADAIAYVNAHGTGTELNDRTETDAIKAALGDHAREVPVSSLKSAIGHLQGAAGAVEAVATLLALRDGVAPPTLGLEHPGEGLDLDYVPMRPRGIDGSTGLSNSFGLGGHNGCVVLRTTTRTNGGAPWRP